MDGKDLFDMPRGNGIVTLKRTIDFDVLPRHFYVLNITVKVCNRVLILFTRFSVIFTD